MVESARARGLEVHEADAVTWLLQQRESSLGSVIATHLVEHLQLEEFLALLDAVASRLRPGGLFIAETPNPTSLFVLGNSYVLDPTHVRPVHPQLLAFLCERAGFREIALEFYAPSDSERVQSIDTSEASGAPDWVAQVNEAFRRLNDTLFGPQDYDVVARIAPEPPAGDGPG